MELIVYRQSTKQRPDGTIVYKGEDARPYIDDHCFLVADGLGGKASIFHQRLNPALFDEDKLMETLFAGVFDYQNEQFEKYVKDSFFELFAVKHCYTDNIYNIKKSGYFGSRIVTAIIVHAMLYEDQLRPDHLFALYHQRETQEQKDQLLEQISRFFVGTVREGLKRIAANANLYNESAFQNVALLGTTLCATIYHETEDGVETLYLSAGDSRPYVWTEEGGLSQLLEDEEGADGGMTNLISANEESSFNIRCNYIEFKKPCVLFNASDGIFDSASFLSQMALEKLILDNAVANSDTAGMGKAIEQFFADKAGHHDDSSTIAMKFFGFDSFDAFKKSAKRRLDTLQAEYLTEMPDLLERNYMAEYESASADLPNRLSALKAKFEEESTLWTWCEKQIKGGKYPPYVEKIKQIDKKITELEQDRRKTAKDVKGLIAKNYVRFVPGQDPKGLFSPVGKLLKIEEDHKKQSEEFSALTTGLRDEFEASTKNLGELIGQICNIGIPEDFSDYEAINLDVVESGERSLAKVFEFLYDLGTSKQGLVRNLARLRDDYAEKNEKLAEDNDEEVSKIRDKVISGEISAETIRSEIRPDDYDDLTSLLEEIREFDSQIASLEKEGKENALTESIEEYWTRNHVQVIQAMINDPTAQLSDALREEAKAITEEMNRQTDEIKKKAETQAELFKKYDTSYGKYLGGKEE